MFLEPLNATQADDIDSIAIPKALEMFSVEASNSFFANANFAQLLAMLSIAVLWIVDL